MIQHCSQSPRSRTMDWRKWNCKPGGYSQARDAASTAQELAPEDWIAAYNMGMIEDRLRNSQAVIQQIQRALTLEIPDSRHRLLANVYLYRAHSRLGDAQAADSPHWRRCGGSGRGWKNGR